MSQTEQDDAGDVEEQLRAPAPVVAVVLLIAGLAAYTVFKAAVGFGLPGLIGGAVIAAIYGAVGYSAWKGQRKAIIGVCVLGGLAVFGGFAGNPGTLLFGALLLGCALIPESARAWLA